MARQRTDPGTVPPFSALVAAWNERRHVQQHIRSFTALGWDECELIVCAGGGDGTLQLARALAAPNVTVLEQEPGEGKQAALRRCLEHARHDLVYLTDADCLFDRGSLTALFEPLVRGTYQVATGGSRPLVDQCDDPFVQYQESRGAYYLANRGEVADGILGRNAALTRAALLAAGGFRDPVATGTDYHLSERLQEAGIDIAYVRGSSVQTEFPTTAGRYLAMWRRWIKNAMIHSPRKQWRNFLMSVVLAAAILTLPLTWLVLPAPVAAVQALAVVLALATRYRELLRSRRTGTAVRYATFVLTPFYMVLDQLAVLAALGDLSRSRTRRRW